MVIVAVAVGVLGRFTDRFVGRTEIRIAAALFAAMFAALFAALFAAAVDAISSSTVLMWLLLLDGSADVMLDGSTCI